MQVRVAHVCQLPVPATAHVPTRDPVSEGIVILSRLMHAVEEVTALNAMVLLPAFRVTVCVTVDHVSHEAVAGQERVVIWVPLTKSPVLEDAPLPAEYLSCTLYWPAEGAVMVNSTWAVVLLIKPATKPVPVYPV